MGKLDDAAKVGIINSEATLKVKHLLWACSMFVGIIAFGVWFGLYTLNRDIKDATAPLQTKTGFKEWEKEEWKSWKDKEWKPHIKEASEANNKANREIGILLDRTDSKAVNTNSIGRNDIEATPPNE